MSFFGGLAKGLTSMIPVIGPAISGAIGYAGQQSTNVANAKQAQQAEQFSAAEAEKNRQFQDKESSTSYQRAVADLKAAGLNPALAYQQGGASSPSGSTGTGYTAHMESAAGAGISSAQRAQETLQSIQAVKTQQAQVDQTKAQTDLTTAQADNVRTMMLANLEEVKQRAALNNALRAKAGTENRSTMEQLAPRIALMNSEFERNVASASEARARVGLVGAQTGVAGTEGELLKYSIPAAANAAAAAQTLWGRKIAPYLNDAKSVSNAFFPWSKYLPTPGGR